MTEPSPRIPFRYRAAAVFAIFACGYALGSSPLPDALYGAMSAVASQARLAAENAAHEVVIARNYRAQETAVLGMNAQANVAAATERAARMTALPAAEPATAPAPPKVPDGLFVMKPSVPAPAPSAPAAAPVAPATPAAADEKIAPPTIDQLLKKGRFGSSMADPTAFGLR